MTHPTEKPTTEREAIALRKAFLRGSGWRTNQLPDEIAAKCDLPSPTADYEQAAKFYPIPRAS